MPTIRGDFDRNGTPDLIWQYDSSGQATVHFRGGPDGSTFSGWAWLVATSPGVDWRLVTTADCNRDGAPDLIWQNQSTRQVTVHFQGGANATTQIGWGWLQIAGAAGWVLAAVADFNGDGIPDLIWQNESTRDVSVHYMGGTDGTVFQSWKWLYLGGLAGWTVTAAADFDGNGVPDLVLQNDVTRQVIVHFRGGADGSTLTGWNWLYIVNAPGWRVKGVADLNRDGVPDLIWWNESSRTVTVHYFGRTNGAVSMLSRQTLYTAGSPGWSPVVP
jgi:hypothetical protein